MHTLTYTIPQTVSGSSMFQRGYVASRYLSGVTSGENHMICLSCWQRLQHICADSPSGKFPSRLWPCLCLALACTIASGPAVPESTQHGDIRDLLSRILFAVVDLFFDLTQREFTEECLDRLQRTSIPAVLEALSALYRLRQRCTEGQRPRFSGIKLHLVTHIVEFIRFYGAPRGFDTASFETANKIVKQYYTKGRKNTSTLELDMLKRVNSTLLFANGRNFA